MASSPDASDVPVPPQQGVAYKRLMAAASVSKVVQAATVALPAVCLSAIGDQFDLGYAGRGLLSSVRMAMLLSVVLVAGYLSDRLGRRHFLWVSMVLIAAGVGATYFANTYGLLLILQGAVGIGVGGLEALVNTLIAELRPKGAGRRLNLVNALFSAGLLGTALLSGALLHAGVRWQLTFLLWPLPALLAAGLYAPRGYPAPHPLAGRVESVRHILGNGLFWLVLGAMVLAGAAEGGLIVWSANYVQDQMAASSWGGAWAIALCGGAMAIGRLITGLAVSRVSPIAIMLVSGVGFVLATTALCFTQQLWLAWALFAAGGLFVACFWPTLLAVASDTIQAGSSTLFALLSAGGVIGCALLPWLIGLLADVYDLRIGLLLLPATMVLQVGVLVAIAVLLGRRDYSEGRA